MCKWGPKWKKQVDSDIKNQTAASYLNDLSGFIKLGTAGGQVSLQRILVISELVQLTFDVILSLPTLVLLSFQCLNLIVTFVDVLQQSLNLCTTNAYIISASTHSPVVSFLTT